MASMTSSRSQNKLAVITEMIHDLDDELKARTKTIQIDWKLLDGELLPTLFVEYFPKGPF